MQDLPVVTQLRVQGHIAVRRSNEKKMAVFGFTGPITSLCIDEFLNAFSHVSLP